MTFYEQLFLALIGPLITLAIAGIAGAIAYTRTAARSETNRDSIVAETRAREKLEADYKTALAKCEADYLRIVSELKTSIASDLEVIHKRYDKHQEQLASALHDLGVEIHGFHKEIAGLRETIARLDARNSQVAGLTEAMERLPAQVVAAVKAAAAVV